MTKLIFSAPETPYKSVTKTGMHVEIQKAFNGLALVCPTGERIDVLMQDSGFQLHYHADFGEKGFDAGWFVFQNGVVTDFSRRLVRSDNNRVEEAYSHLDERFK